MEKRRVWVIAKKEEIEQSDIDDALFNNCSEIAQGIPPTLQETISEKQLPYVYEEIEIPPSEPPRDLAVELDELKVRVEALESKLEIKRIV